MELGAEDQAVVTAWFVDSRGRALPLRLRERLREVLIDHELCHIGVELDEQGNPELTDQGRPKVFIKPHDIEDFQVIIDRHGETNRRLHQFGQEQAKLAEGKKKSGSSKPAAEG
jgi:hypothetical protein